MPREIGWSIEANLLYQIKKELSSPKGTPSTTSTTTTIAP
jgi:hypothetical protein